MTEVVVSEEVITLTLVAEQGPPGVSADHSLLLNLDADDHPQYLNNTRGDARYSALTHNHDGVYEPADAAIQEHLTDTNNPHNVTAFQVGADEAGAATSAVSAHEASAGVHPIAGVSGLQTALDGKSDLTHNHDAAYAPIAEGVTNGDAHDHSGGDGGQIAYSSLSGLPTLGTAAAQNTSAFEAAGGISAHAAITTTHGISAFGASLVDDADAATARSTLGLGTAATTASSAYATSTQGSTADSAVQPGDDAAGLGSGAATDGYVLTADGVGGSAWEAAAVTYAGAASEVHTATAKTTPADADEIGLVDSAASWGLKKLSWANIKATLSSFFAVLAGKSGGQTIIGGTGVTDKLMLQGTSGIGTGTASALEINTGNNGATKALTILNNGNVGVGLSSPATKIDVNGVVSVNGSRTVYNAESLGSFTGSLFLGGGGQSISHTTSSEGYYNTGVGIGALSAVTTGNSNTTNGYQSLFSNTTGNNNNANGYQSLFSNTTGNSNTANGGRSLYLNTTGIYNTANGYQSLYSNTTGRYNTANGYQSLYLNTTGRYNSANGSLSLYSSTTGDSNTANGYQSLYSSTTGNNNTANGYQAGRYIADGSTENTICNSSIFIGYNTKANADGETNQIVIGYNATGAGSNTVVLGNSSIAKTLLKGNVGINSTPSTEQLRLGYDATYYASFTVNSSGALTQSAIGGQTIIGGTGVTSKVTIQGTSANGTSTATAMECKVGNNGNITAMYMRNDGNIYIPGPLENTTSGEGIILKSPDGTRYKITVANGGTLSISAT